MKTLHTFVAGAVLAAASLSTSAFAQPAQPGKAPGASTVAASSEMTDGEVRKIDKENRKITLKHGEIKNLDMPAMTMVFQLKDPALLDTLQVGAKVKFTAEKTEGAIVVTRIESAT